MLMLLNMHVTSVMFLVRLNNLPWLRASIGVTLYSIHLFLCNLDHLSNCIPVGHGSYTQFTRPFPCFVKVLGARASTFFIGFGTAFYVSSFFLLDVTCHHYTSRALPCRSFIPVYCNLLQSNYQALTSSEIKLSSSWWEKFWNHFLSYD